MGYESKKEPEIHQTSSNYQSAPAICGIIIAVISIYFTVKRIVNNEHTSITTYPMDYTAENIGPNDEENAILDHPIVPVYKYPRISLEEVRAELAREQDEGNKQNSESSKDIDIAIATQSNWIPHDFPSDVNPNTLEHLFHPLYQNTEFYRRFITESDANWTAQLLKSKAIYNASLYDTLPICLQSLNRLDGYGYRNWRDAQVHYMAHQMSCSVAIHWGQLRLCPFPGGEAADVYNIFAVLFYDNSNFVASHIGWKSFSDTSKYPPLHSYNQWFAGKGHAMYDLNGPFINGSQSIIDNANANIIPAIESRAHGLIWPQTAKQYDKELNVVNDASILDTDIDHEFAELIGVNGAMDIRPVLNYYGLMVMHLRYKWRQMIVEYIEQNWKDKLVIAYHVQMDNKADSGFKGYIEQIIGTLQHILCKENNFDIVEQKSIVVYISTDAGAGTFVNDLQTFMDELKTKVNDLKNNMTNAHAFESIEVALREQMRLPFGNGHVVDRRDKLDNMDECAELVANIQIDAELLGLSDILILPSTHGLYKSTYTRLSRALMMKRYKIICKTMKNQEFVCKNFETKTTVALKL